jgi:hypothetical protein
MATYATARNESPSETTTNTANLLLQGTVKSV